MIQTKLVKARPAWFSLERLNQELLLAAFLILVALAFSLVRPDFLSGGNLLRILIDSSFVVVAAVGVSMVIIAGGIDISIGSMLALCAVVGGLLAQMGAPAPLAWLGIVLTGVFLGLINGTLVTWAGIPSIIVTLGMLSILRGLAILVSGGSWIRNLPQNFYIGQQSFLGVPVPIWVMLIVLVLVSAWLNYTPLGRQFYAVGGNREAARLGGIPVKRIQLLSFTLNGFLIGLATLIFATRFSAIQVNSGVGFELRAITAAVVGGVSIMGGSGTVLGAVLGVLLLEVIGSGMVFMRISAYWFQAIQGLLILVAVVFDILRKRRLGEM